MSSLRFGLKISGAIVLASLTAGCLPGKYAGGGQIASANPDSSQDATIAFTIKAEDTDGDRIADSVKGQFQYNDHGTGTAFHGAIADGGEAPVGVGTLNPDGDLVFTDAVVFLSGDYTPQPANQGPGGRFEVALFFWPEDSGIPDEARVSLIGGVHDGYLNDQAFEHGNMSILPIK
jgi:hypothetical protein